MRRGLVGCALLCTIVSVGCEETGAGLCAGVTCSDHGICVSDGIEPRCSCNRGYESSGPGGLECVPVGADGDADGDDGGEVDGGADADDAGEDGDADEEADVEEDGGEDGETEADVPPCGNGVVEDPEECDDANTTPGDGCEPDCRWTCPTTVTCDDAESCNGLETCLAAHVCEDGTPPGDGTACTGCSVGPCACRAGLCAPVVCGDTIVDPGEECDDGNPDNTDACLSDCSDATCSDGFVWTGHEACDGDPARTCSTTCGSSGTQPCETDCSWGVCAAPAEVCNAADDDCDGTPDDDFACIQGATGVSCTATCGTTGSGTCTATCSVPSGADCTPPGETCNAVDDDCDGTTDDGFACIQGATGVSCTTTCGSTGTGTCTSACAVPTGAACGPPSEACNAADDDCDGSTDETFPCVRGQTTECTTSSGCPGTGACTASCALPGVSECTPTAPAGGWTVLAVDPAAPSARVGHTAVWTGSEMVIWGGYDRSPTYFTNGGRYSPATRTWRALPTADAPASAIQHSAVWTGTEMIVWGGLNGTISACVGAGAAYNPSTNTWTMLPTSGAPTPRGGHAAVWTGSEMIIWGGRCEAPMSAALGDGAAYNPSTRTWRSIPEGGGSPSARTGSPNWAVWTGTEMLVWGGITGTTTTLGDGAGYDPVALTWSPLPAVGSPRSRTQQVAVWTGAEMLVWGGMHYSPVTQLSDGGGFRPGETSWRSVPSSPHPTGLSSSSAVWTGREMVIWGGYDYGGSGIRGDGVRFDPGTRLWTYLPQDPAVSARFGHTAVWTGREMLVWGGGDPVGEDKRAVASYYPPCSPPGWGVGCTWSAPENLGSGVNTTLNDYRGSISSDGARLFLSRNVPGDGSGTGDELFMSTLVGGVWTSAVNVGSPPNITGYADFNPHISLDGTLLTFMSRRPGSVFVDDVWQSSWTAGAWSAPVQLVDAGQHPDNPWLSADGTRLYVSWNGHCVGTTDQAQIAYATRSGGVWGSLVCLGDPINISTGRTTSAFLDPSETIMAFSSARPDSLGGTDIHISQKVGGTWQTPVHLLNGVSSAANDEVGYVSPDGRTMHFTSDRTGGYGSSDIYVSHCRECIADADCAARGLVCNESWAICVVPSCTGQPNFTPCETVTSPERSYDICSSGTCVSPGCGDATCNAPGPNFPLADSTQRLCYDASTSIACPGTPGTAGCETTAFCGQDGQFGWDVTHAATERFARSATAEPVVTDNVTGLVWQGCSRGQTGSSCTGTATTGNWAPALAHCDALTWGGFEDWRLPNPYELQSIVDYGTPSVPTIDPTAFPASPAVAGPSNYYWSSSYSHGRTSWSWMVNFYYGLVTDGGESTGSWYVRCVRGGLSTVPVTRFVRSEPAAGFPVTADAATGLIWQGCAAGQTGSSCTGTASTFSWQAALDYCQDSTWAGSTDWYLPNASELASIVDHGRSSPSINTTAFPATPSDWFWSSSSWAAGAVLAWNVHFHAGTVNIYSKTDVYDVRCVRRGP